MMKKKHERTLLLFAFCGVHLYNINVASYCVGWGMAEPSTIISLQIKRMLQMLGGAEDNGFS